MNNGPTVALIINTFNQADYLARVLAAVAQQTALPDEVVLADDGSGEETRQLFAKWAADQQFGTHHAWQKNEGFRRARILNLAIAHVQSDYIVFLDGDTLPHPRFVSEHRALAAAGRFVQGRRALIEQRAAVYFGKGTLAADRRRAFWSGQMRGVANAFHWPVPFRRFRSGLRGIRGCNLGIWRGDLVRVNGYNEAFTGWGREDAELASRLTNSGVRRVDVRGWALCYHLWHPPASRAGLPINDQLLESAQSSASQTCELGLSQHLQQVGNRLTKSPF
jgi:glycosyltransferase involved in cell wall biosynthesis